MILSFLDDYIWNVADTTIEDGAKNAVNAGTVLQRNPG